MTLTFVTGLPLASFTVTTNGAKAPLACAVWPLPEVTVTEVGGPVILVKVNVMGATDPALALTE